MCSSGHIEECKPSFARSAPKVSAPNVRAGKDTNRIDVDVVFASKTRGHGAIFFFFVLYFYFCAPSFFISRFFVRTATARDDGIDFSRVSRPRIVSTNRPERETVR